MVKSKTQMAEKNLPEAPEPERVQETGESALSRARTAVADRRTAILDCAEEVFLDKGFQAASMASIAGILGGSKGTLYNYFPSKEDLFIACVTRRCQILQDQLSSVVSEGKSLEETLHKIGKRFVEMVYSDETVAQYRMILAEVSRTPELGQAFYANGPRRGAERIAEYFTDLRDQGLLRFEDPLRTARHFASLCDSMFAKGRHCGAMQVLDPDEVDREVLFAVRAFLAIYGTKQN